MRAQTLCLCISYMHTKAFCIAPAPPYCLLVLVLLKKYHHLFCTDFNEMLSESCSKKFSKVVTYLGSVNLSGPKRKRENNCMDIVS